MFLGLKYIPDELISQIIRLKQDSGKVCSTRVQVFIKEAIEEKLAEQKKEQK